MPIDTSVLARLDARDRALFTRLATGPSRHPLARWAWTLITHAGGVCGSVAAATLPMLFDGAIRTAARHALVALLVSHLIVQAIKRTVGRSRPSRRDAARSWMDEPDRFSFPSGHSAAAMSVAAVYAIAFPPLAALLVTTAALVGFSRVRLGVHYPGDVVAGQAIALATAVGVAA